jgi:hypothetical protein
MIGDGVNPVVDNQLLPILERSQGQPQHLSIFDTN